MSLVFQVFDWRAEDLEDDETGGRMFVATAHGRTACGETVAVRLEGFRPSFCARPAPHGGGPRGGESGVRERLTRAVADALGAEMSKEWDGKATPCERGDFFEFTGGDRMRLWRLTFSSLRAARRAASALRDTGAWELFDTKVDALVRLMHDRGLPAAGWVGIDESDAEHGDWATSARCVTASYRSASRADCEAGMAPARVASFDIECMSEGGGFPVARKTYRRAAKNVVDVMGLPAARGMSKGARKDLALAVLLLSVGIEPDGAAAAAAAALSAAHPNALTRGSINPARLKGAATREIILERACSVIDDVVNYATQTVSYVDARMPRTPMEQVAAVLDARMPSLEGDGIIQIGVATTIVGVDDGAASRRWVAVLGTCDGVPGVDVVECSTEGDVILEFAKHLRETDPDFLTGYNIFGFDMNYVYERSVEIGVWGDVTRALSRDYGCPARFETRKLSSSARGDNEFRTIEVPGRVSVDLLTVVRTEHALESYKLDSVAKHFTGESKRDVSPQDIFRLHRGGAGDRAVVADYCVQDCELVLRLLDRLKTVVNTVAMATISSVPISYVVLRGQGVKVMSLLARECTARGYAIRELPMPPREIPDDAPRWMQKRNRVEMERWVEPEAVQGATVLTPEWGLHEDAVGVLDFGSLYPSAIMSHGLSPDARVSRSRYEGLPGYVYTTVSHRGPDGGERSVTFAKRESSSRTDPSTMPIVPAVEMVLLSERRRTRARMKHKRVTMRDGAVIVGDLATGPDGRTTVNGEEVDSEAVQSVADAHGPFMLSVLDGEQNSLKRLANSVYGQLGARTSPIRDPKTAASVTAVGRSLILKAREYVESRGGRVVYGDTDSVFIRVPVYGDGGEPLAGRAALSGAISRARAIARDFSAGLPWPHELQYEKTFCPWLSLAKKKYVGMMYQSPDDEGTMKSMGIVLKRRDNAPIVKTACSSFLDKLLVDLDVHGAVAAMCAVLDRVVEGRVTMDELTVSKTLRAEYKDRGRIAHAVLAARVGDRDPGNAPQINDRIQMVHVRLRPCDAMGALQGDKVETPEYVAEKGLDVDLEYYLADQIQNPAVQMLATVVDRLPPPATQPSQWAAREASLEAAVLADGRDSEETRERVNEIIRKEREAEARKLIFGPRLARLRNRYAQSAKASMIASMFRTHAGSRR